jgi:hypothetical protein
MYARTRRPTATSIRPRCAPGYSRRVQHVTVRILHPAATLAVGALGRALEAARMANAEALAGRFLSVGADDVTIETGGADGRSFGARLRDLVAGVPARGGLVVLGSGSIPLAAARDASEFAAAAGSGERRALANNRYSADVVAIGAAAALASVPDLPSDNALPRWLEEEAGFAVEDLRRRWRLAIDLDSPLDVLLTGGALADTIEVEAVVDRIRRIRAVGRDRRAELVVTGRTSASALRWLERNTASRTRALVEERGLRAIGLADQRGPARPPRSGLAMILDDRGPKMLGPVLAQLGDAAIVDTRVLLAHRLGADESAWPPAEDRFASDLLLPERIGDPWLRTLTASARDAAIPVLLGGHTLVGPGVRLLLGRRR